MSTVLDALREREGMQTWRPALPPHRFAGGSSLRALAAFALAGLAAGALFLLGKAAPRSAPGAPASVPAHAAADEPPAVVPEHAERPWARMQPRRSPAPPWAAVPTTAEPQPPAAATRPPATEAGGVALPSMPADVRVESLAYSPLPGGSTARLIMRGRSVTLHEGEAAGGVEVQLILPDAVFIRSGADVVEIKPGRPASAR